MIFHKIVKSYDKLDHNNSGNNKDTQQPYMLYSVIMRNTIYIETIICNSLVIYVVVDLLLFFSQQMIQLAPKKETVLKDCFLMHHVDYIFFIFCILTFNNMSSFSGDYLAKEYI